jgi:ribosome-binding protein aMBF1 (putative translation factor)
MLKNDRQYRIAKVEVCQLEASLKKLMSELTANNEYLSIVPDLRAKLDAIRRELEEYEQLRSGRYIHRIVPKPESLEALPRSLIQARIAAGLTQKELAHRLGLKEQQVQHYEATDYASARLSRLITIAKVLSNSS